MDVLVIKGFAKDLNVNDVSLEVVKNAVAEGKMPTGSRKPIFKDTISLNTNGCAHIRIIANNPGFWFVHCHINEHIATGLDIVFQVGELSDIPETPKGFPKCSHFTPALDLSTDTYIAADYEGDYCNSYLTYCLALICSADLMSSADSTCNASQMDIFLISTLKNVLDHWVDK